jgi:hypothetical protein
MDRRDFLKNRIEKFNTIFNKSAVGWDIKLIASELIVTDPFNPNPLTVRKEYPLKAIISRNEDKYLSNTQNNNTEFKLCKIFVQDLLTLIAEGANIEVDGLKKSNVTISIDKGTDFQITNERLEGFNKQLIVLEIERVS